MSRFVWPSAMQLHAAERPELLRSERFVQLVKKLEGRGTIPVALRWTTHPSYGFPVAPFSVYRRERGNYPVEKLTDDASVTGTFAVEWGLRPMYLVAIRVTTISGSLRISALDDRRHVIPGQDQVVSAPMTVIFRANSIAALRITGHGTTTGAVGVPSEALANAAGWVRFDTVGLPFEKGVLDPARYDPVPQGVEPPSSDGVTAALQRLLLAEAAHLPPPALPIPPGSVDWPAPPPKPFLDSVRATIGRSIRRCIDTSNNATFGATQFHYVDPHHVAGITQADQVGGGTDPAKVNLPVTGITQLMASGDGFAALALGYGTMDIGRAVHGDTGPGHAAPVVSHVVGALLAGTHLERPEPTSAASEVALVAGPMKLQSERSDATALRGAFDYMVSGVFLTPLGKFEVAALSDVPAPPDAPAALSFEQAHVNRPPAVDSAGGEAVRVIWSAPLVPTAFAVAVSRHAGAVRVLNAKRLCGTGFDPFFPPRLQVIEGEPAPDDVVTFTDAVSPTPTSGTETHHYAVAALDVLGRWSGWRVDDRITSAPAVQMPTILQVDLLPDVALPTGGGLGGVVEVTLGWNAEDRTVERFEIFGKFIDPTSTPPAAFTSGFLDGATNTFSISARIQGSAVVGERLGTVTNLSATPTDQRFRVAINDVVFPFGAGSKVAFAAWARAYEHVRSGLASGLTPPRRGEAQDPRPPTVPGLTPNLTWTALPDATRRARGILTWAASTNTAGYVLWEATETAILDALDQPAPAPGTSLVARALTLQGLLGTVSNAEDKLTSVFTRWNSALLTTTRAEIDLPGSADILYAYRISATSATNVDGDRSTGLAFLAVRTRAVPGPPSLSAKQVTVAGVPKVRVTASPAAGAVPAVDDAPIAFRLYRVRKSAAAADLGTMGPPVKRENDSGWASDGSAKAIVDDPGPSWKPLYYRAVAVAPDNLPNGNVGGESAPSGVLRFFLPPSAPPTISNVVVTPLIQFRTDLPDFATPMGTARIEVFQQLVVGGRISRVLVARGDPATIPVGAATDTSLGKAVSGGTITWSVGRGAITGARVVIVVTDPLGRATESTQEL